MQTVTTLSEKKNQLIVWVLLFLVPITGMGVDLIAPSLPALALVHWIKPSIDNWVWHWTFHYQGHYYDEQKDLMRLVLIQQRIR